MSTNVKATNDEIRSKLPGDNLLPKADIVMDRAFTLDADPAVVWPWLQQLGKNRAGWYFPRSIERFMIPDKKGLRMIDPQLQNLEMGKVIDDWGGKKATFKVAILQPSRALVYTSTRGKVHITWAIIMRPHESGITRVQLRLRMESIGQKWIANTVGDLMDKLTVIGLAAGLKERLRDNK